MPSLRTISPRPIAPGLTWRDHDTWSLPIRAIAPRLLQFHSSPADTSWTGIVNDEEAHVRWIALKEPASTAPVFAIAVDGGGPSREWAGRAARLLPAAVRMGGYATAALMNYLNCERRVRVSCWVTSPG
jgi:hypothetical protein